MRKFKFGRMLAVLLALSVALSSFSYALKKVYADDSDIDTMEQEKEELEQEAQEQKETISATEEEIAEAEKLIEDVMAEVSKINDELLEVGKAITGLNAEIADINAQLAAKEAELKESQEELATYYESFKGRIQMMYESERTSYLDILLNASSIADFFSRLEYIAQVVEYDNNVMDMLHKCEEKIRTEKEEIAALKTSLEEAFAKQQERQGELEALLKNKEESLKKIEDNKLALQIRKEKEEEARNQLLSQISEIQGNIEEAEYQNRLKREQEEAAKAAEQKKAEEKAKEESSANKENENSDVQSETGEEHEENSDTENSEHEESLGTEESSEYSEEESKDEESEPEESEEESEQEDNGKEDEEESGSSYSEPENEYGDADWRANDWGYWNTWPGIGTGELGWPCDGSIATSLFGPRVHPITGEYRNHNGLDLAANYGSGIYACQSGTVVTVGWDEWGWGNYVVVDHENGFMTLYAHCSEIIVNEGDYVSYGQTIAYIGTTGLSTGPHLHLEVYLWGSAVDPEDYL